MGSQSQTQLSDFHFTLLPLALTSLIFQSKGLKNLLQKSQFKSINSSLLSIPYGPTSHPYITTGKTIALTRWTFVGKEMSLIFSMLSRFVITFLPRNNHLLISWLQSPSAVILEPWSILCLFLFLQAQHQAPGAKHFSQLIWFELNLTRC